MVDPNSILDVNSNKVLDTGLAPQSATMSIGWQTPAVSADFPDAHAGWYLDPNPNDLSDFAATSTTPFDPVTKQTTNRTDAFLDCPAVGFIMALYFWTYSRSSNMSWAMRWA